MIEFIDEDVPNNIININLYLLDSPKTIKQRLCAKLNINFNANNEYIHFQSNIDFLKKEQTIYFINYFQKIIDYATLNKIFAVKHLSFNDYFIPFFLNNKTLISSIESMIINKHYDLSFYFNQYYNTIESFIDKNEYINKIDEIVGKHTNLSSFQNKIAFLIAEYNNSLQLFLKKELTQTNYIVSFEETIGEPFSNFTIESNSISIKFKIDKSILELFNDIQVNETYSFVKCKGFYKFFKHIKPNVEWLDQNDESDDKLYIFYRNEVMTISELDPETFICNFNTTVKTESSLSELKVILYDLLPYKILEFSDIQSNEIKGDFFFPDFRFNRYVMSDFISINEIFRNLFTVNEDKIPQSQKNTYHVYFKKNQVKLTAFFSNMETKDFVPTTVFHVKVKSSKFDFIEPFQLILSKLIEKEYKTKFDSVVNIYKNFKSIISTFDQQFTDGRLISMKEKSNIFPPKYRSKIQKYPNIYSNDDETLRAIRENKSFPIMKFPTFPNNLIDDSVRYVCDRSKGYTIPGLNVNSFENKDTFPFLPQCFQKEQVVKKNDPAFNQRFRYYSIEGQDDVVIPEIEVVLPVAKEKQQKIKLSGFMNKNIFGFLPVKIKEIFTIADIDFDNFSWYRLGVTDSHDINSFILAVLTALNHNDLTSFNVDDIRTEILTDLAVLCKQENFDKSLTEIVDDISSNKTYFNPRLYIHLLEHRYNCNIILFDKNSFVLPKCINGFYINTNKKNFIFIYEHSDETHSRCEIIGRHSTDKKIPFQTVFNSNDSMTKTIFQLYYDLYNIHLKIFPNKLLENSKSQIIDVSGKCRGFNFDFEESFVSMFFAESIYQPVNVPIGNIYEIAHEKIETIVSTFHLIDFSIKDSFLFAKIVIDGRSISVYFKIKAKTNEIDLSSFNLYNKLSRYISQYFIWLYSKFLHEFTNLKDIYLDPYKNYDEIIDTINIDSNKQKFIQYYIQIIPLFPYKSIPNKFSLENSGIISNSKLVIKSEETLQKLFYVLKMYIQRHLITFLSFFQKKTIDNYYIDIIDFDQKPSQFICKGYNYTLQWIQDFFDTSLFSSNFVFNTLRNDKTWFYYQNKNYFNGKNFTVYKSLSLKDALSISLNAKNVFIDYDIDFILSTFKNNVLLKTYYVNHNKPNNYDIHIVVQDSIFFSFLT